MRRRREGGPEPVPMWVADIRFWAPALRWAEGGARYQAWHKAVDAWVERQIERQGGDDDGYSVFDPGPWKIDEARAAIQRGETW